MPPVSTSTKCLTFEEYLTYDDGSDRRYELLDTGELVELPYENDINILLAADLYEYLKQFVNRHLIRTSSTPVQVSPTVISLPSGKTKPVRQQSRIPDLIVLTKKGAEQVFGKPSGLALTHDNPILVVEFVSESNASDDYFDKRVQYEARGIGEYWIADRHQGQVTVLSLEKGRYIEAIYRNSEVIHSKAFPTATLSAHQLLTVDEV